VRRDRRVKSATAQRGPTSAELGGMFELKGGL
jgi:hypothetical protein